MISTLKCVIFVPADTAGGVEEPVHEYPGTLVVGIVRQEPVPLEFLLTGAVTRAPGCGAHPVQTDHYICAICVLYAVSALLLG